MDKFKIIQQTDDDQIIIPDENGDEHLYEVVVKFEVDDSEQQYVILAPAGASESEEEEEVEVTAYRLEEKEGDDLALFEIESDEEWDMVEEVFNTLNFDEE